MGTRCPLSAACASARWPPLRSRRSAAESQSPTTARHPSAILSHIAPCEADRSPAVGMFLSTRRALPSDAWVSVPPEVWKVLLVAGACSWRCLLRLPRRSLGAVDPTGAARGRCGAEQVRPRDRPVAFCPLCIRGRRETPDSRQRPCRDNCPKADPSYVNVTMTQSVGGS